MFAKRDFEMPEKVILIMDKKQLSLSFLLLHAFKIHRRLMPYEPCTQ